MTVGIDEIDNLRQALDRPYLGPVEHAQAYAYLQRRHAEGRLPPVLDGTGDPLADYVNILGLRL